MNTFAVHLQALRQSETIDSVVSFSAHDRSGSFGLLAGHERMVACLDFGLAAFATAGGERRYVALPGGVLYFRDNELRLSTRRYLHDADFRRVAGALEAEFRAEEEGLRELRETLRRAERDLFRRLWELGRAGERLL